MKTYFVAALLAFTALDPAHALDITCPSTLAFTTPDKPSRNEPIVQREVRLVGEALMFTSELRVNTDGAPNSYHPDWPHHAALNNLCNAMNVTPDTGPHAGVTISAFDPASMPGTERCQTILDNFRASRDAGYAILPSAEVNMYAIANKRAARNATNYAPCVIAEGPYAGYLQSTTALAADPAADICSPSHWIDSNVIPYVTRPGHNAHFASAHADLGDLALVHRRVSDRDVFVVAVIADIGNRNELGEGSLALHDALEDSAHHTLPADVTTFIFPNRSATRPITAASLAAQRDTLLQALGGEATAAVCVAPHTP